MFDLDVSKVDRVLLLGTHLLQPLGCHRAGANIRAGEAQGVRVRGRAPWVTFEGMKRSASAGAQTCTTIFKAIERIDDYKSTSS